jgi:hypothetical protein
MVMTTLPRVPWGEGVERRLELLEGEDLLLIQAFSAPATGPLPDPPTPRRMYRALRRLGGKDRQDP